jgi:hypothetical protein
LNSGVIPAVKPVCETLYLFVDGQLDEAAAALFREHLSWCRHCPAALENALVLDAIADQGVPESRKLGHTREVPILPPGALARAADVAWAGPGSRERRRGLIWLLMGAAIGGLGTALWLWL